MRVGLDERVVGRDHRQTRGGHSEVEAKSRPPRPVEGPVREWGRRKQIGSGRGSHRARARIAPSCVALLGRRRRGESLLRHRMSARVLRMPARGVVADVTRSARIGRERRELSRESDIVAFRKGPSRRGWCQQDGPAVRGSEVAVFNETRFVGRKG